MSKVPLIHQTLWHAKEVNVRFSLLQRAHRHSLSREIFIFRCRKNRARKTDRRWFTLHLQRRRRPLRIVKSSSLRAVWSRRNSHEPRCHSRQRREENRFQSRLASSLQRQHAILQNILWTKARNDRQVEVPRSTTRKAIRRFRLDQRKWTSLS